MITFLYTFYRFGRGTLAALKDPEFEALVTLVAITLGVGTVFYHNAESWSWLDSLYFSVTTLATVGFGDLAPHTSMGKIFTIGYIFVGVGVLLAFINTLAHHAVQENKNSGILPWRNNKSS